MQHSQNNVIYNCVDHQSLFGRSTVPTMYSSVYSLHFLKQLSIDNTSCYMRMRVSQMTKLGLGENNNIIVAAVQQTVQQS